MQLLEMWPCNLLANGTNHSRRGGPASKRIGPGIQRKGLHGFECWQRAIERFIKFFCPPSIVSTEEVVPTPTFLGPKKKRRAMSDHSESSREFAAEIDFARELTRALEDEQFFLVYQPEIDLHTNAFVGVEALIRWRHPQRGVMNPDTFLPELESSGLIMEVGRWALATACSQGAEWHDKGFRFTVSVNISAMQFAWDGFVNEVEEVLLSSRFPAGLLVLEFAQRILDGELAERLVDLAELGVRLAVDDFEPGQSLLSDLEGLPITVLKLDRRFVATLSDSPAGTELVHSLVDLAKNKNVQIVASGIEDAAQRQRLQLEDVGVGQGFLFSKPHEAAEIDRYLQDFSIFSGKPL